MMYHISQEKKGASSTMWQPAEAMHLLQLELSERALCALLGQLLQRRCAALPEAHGCTDPLVGWQWQLLSAGEPRDNLDV